MSLQALAGNSKAVNSVAEQREGGSARSTSSSQTSATPDPWRASRFECPVSQSEAAKMSCRFTDGCNAWRWCDSDKGCRDDRGKALPVHGCQLKQEGIEPSGIPSDSKDPLHRLPPSQFTAGYLKRAALLTPPVQNVACSVASGVLRLRWQKSINTICWPQRRGATAPGAAADAICSCHGHQCRYLL